MGMALEATEAQEAKMDGNWYIDDDGTVVIPEGATPCCGLANGAHYALCPSSPDHYSVEREREDEVWYGMDMARGELAFDYSDRSF